MKLILILSLFIPFLGFARKPTTNLEISSSQEKLSDRLKKKFKKNFCKQMLINKGNAFRVYMQIEDIRATFNLNENTLIKGAIEDCEKIHGKSNCIVSSNEQGSKFFTFFMVRDSFGEQIGENDDVYYKKVCSSPIK